LRHLVCFIKPKFKILRSVLAFFLLFGTLFVPVRAVEAGFFSSLFGDQALADANAKTTAPSQSGSNSQNSQTLALLRADVSSASVLQDENSQSSTSDNTTDDPNAATIDGNALRPSISPINENTSDCSGDDTSVYVIKSGDSLAWIAKTYNVSVNTILSANDMKKGDKLAEGEVLLILPCSGVQYIVKQGDSLQSIAKHYKVGVSDIASSNDLATNAKLAAGGQLMIPGADDMMMADEGGSQPAPNLGSALSRDIKYYESHPFIQDIVDYFINPVPIGHKTQGLHGPGHRGIDIGAPMGAPILAAASGIVELAHTGWSGGYGNMVIIEHSNGTKTLYGHMSKIATYTGAQVTQGETIGFVGSTGHSTGPHLHFEVFNARNPGADWSWKPS
jgi:LysM repeat protein